VQGERQGPTLPSPRQQVRVLTTGYCSGLGLKCGIHPRWDDGFTADGSRVKRGLCAADWRVFKRNTRIKVPQYGMCRVADTGNLVKGRHIDLYFESRDEAIRWGKRYLVVEVY